MKILITGGAGFIGTNLSIHFIENNPKYEVVVVDNFKAGPHEYPTHLFQRKNFRFVNGDITDPTFVHNLLQEEQPKVIINCAHAVDTDQAIQAYTGNYNLLKSANDLLKDEVRYIYISSDEVYGQNNQANGLTPHGVETDPLKPQTVSAAIQTGADIITQAYFKNHAFPTTVIRPANLFGPYQKPDRLIAKIIDHALHNKDIQINGDGTQSRTWLYIEDFCVFVNQVIHSNHNLSDGKIYNLTGDLEISLLEVTELILTLLNKSKNLITLLPSSNTSTPIQLDSNIARNTFNWLPQTEFKKGLEETVNWYRQNTN